MRRLYLQIYLAFLALLVVVVVAAGLLGAAFRNGEGPRQIWVEGFAAIVAEGLPADAGPTALRQILDARSEALPLDFALWDRQGVLVAATGADWPKSAEAPGRPRFERGRPARTRVVLDDGRQLGIRFRHSRDRHVGLWLSLLGIGLVVAVGAYPLARRITRRLEALRTGVEAFGRGDLHARVVVRGRDEVAAVAGTFNRAADRIETLVESERRLVANASHELRSPLARLRVAVELLRAKPGDDRHAVEAERNIAELDALVGDLLLGSRLEAQGRREGDPEVDLDALFEALCASEGVSYRGTPATIRGDAKALRRMLRNLIDNARQHGGGEIRVELESDGTRCQLAVRDQGPGIHPDHRARIFEPFFRGGPRAASDERGSGLGLALVRQIARYHGGDAHIAASERGTHVIVQLSRDDGSHP